LLGKSPALLNCESAKAAGIGGISQIRLLILRQTTTQPNAMIVLEITSLLA
jgi:hypothetical protein